jgi:hypothetical protein
MLTLCEEIAEGIAARLEQEQVFRLAVDFSQADVDDQVRLLRSPVANKKHEMAEASGPKRRSASRSTDAPR